MSLLYPSRSTHPCAKTRTKYDQCWGYIFDKWQPHACGALQRCRRPFWRHHRPMPLGTTTSISLVTGAARPPPSCSRFATCARRRRNWLLPSLARSHRDSKCSGWTRKMGEILKSPGLSRTIKLQTHLVSSRILSALCGEHIPNGTTGMRMVHSSTLEPACKVIVLSKES